MKPVRAFDFLAVIFLFAAATFYLLMTEPWPLTSFEWPQIDIGPHLERIEDPNFLPDDFVTDSMAAPNPRWISSYTVVAVNKLLFLNWHQSFLLIKILFLLFLPFLFYKFISNGARSFLKPKLSEELNIDLWSAVFVFLALLFYRLQYQVMLGDYLQFEFKATAQAMGTFWGLLGSGLIHKRWMKVGVLFMGFGCLTHPTIGLFLFLIHHILENKYEIRALAIRFMVAVLIPFVTLLVAFSPEVKLATQEFIDIYVFFRVPHHYNILHYGFFKAIERIVIVLLMLLGSGAYLNRRFPQVSVFRTSLLLSMVYLGAMFSQWFFVHIFPWRVAVLIGAVRISTFTYLMVGPFIACVLAVQFKDRLPSIQSKLGLKIEGLKKWRLPSPILLFFPTIVFALFMVSDNDPVSRIMKSNSLYPWIVENTNSSQVFAVPLAGGMAEEFTLVTKRKTFVSHIFPFREEYYPEYRRRWRAVMGSSVGDRNNTYAKKSLSDLQPIVMSENIDFYIFNKNEMSESLKNKTPLFESEKSVIFSREQLSI